MSKGSYSLDTPADREDIAYNPRADAAFDDADFTEEKAGAVDVAQRGGSNLATGFDAQQEDNEAARSEETGKVPRREVEELQSSLRPEERNVQSRTRHAKVDAFQQERSIDAAVDKASDLDAGMN